MVTWVAFSLSALAAENFVLFILLSVGAIRILPQHIIVRASLYLHSLFFYFPSLPFFEEGGVQFQDP